MIAVIQSRTDKSLEHEQKCFEKYLPYQELEFFSIFKDQDKDKIKDAGYLMEHYDKIIIAGSSEVWLSHDDDMSDIAKTALLPTIKRLVEANFPTLGICFGHQLISMALGSVIAGSASQSEGGIQTIRFTDRGWSDPLFEGLHNPLSVSEGHDDSVVTMPDGVVHLAFSEKCPAQAMRVGDNIYGVQFHPELTKEDLHERWRVSKPYKGKEIGLNKSDRNHGPTILNNFASLPATV